MRTTDWVPEPQIEGVGRPERQYRRTKGDRRMSRNQLHELLHMAAAGAAVTTSDITSLPLPPGTSRAELTAAVGAAVEQCQQHVADGARGLARQVADEMTRHFPDYPPPAPTRTPTEGLGPAELATLIRR
jgi:hypothetical protein